MTHINAFAEERKELGKMIEYVIFFERKFEIEYNQLLLKLDNEFQVTQFESIKYIFVDFLKKIYGHSFIVTTKVEFNEEKKQLFSSSDKYNHLAEQYPELNELKRRLGLEVEY